MLVEGGRKQIGDKFVDKKTHGKGKSCAGERHEVCPGAKSIPGMDIVAKVEGALLCLPCREREKKWRGQGLRWQT